MSRACSRLAPAQYNFILHPLTSPSQDPAQFSELDEVQARLHVESMYIILPLLTSPSQDPAQFSQLDEARVRLHVESMFLFSLVWSVGCSCATNDHRRMFDAFIRAAVACQLEEYVSPSGEK